MTALANGAPSEASKIAEFMGLPRWRQIDDLALVETVKKGFPAKTVQTVIRRVDPNNRFLQPTDIISKATLHRRAKDQKPLSKDDSEKIFALSKVFAEIMRIYHGDTDQAARFLVTEHPMLGGRPPIELAKESIAGAELVLKLLWQADAGVAA